MVTGFAGPDGGQDTLLAAEGVMPCTEDARLLSNGADRFMREKVLGALAAIVVIDAVYSTIAKDALSDEGALPLIFSFYRDAFAFPILIVLASIVDGPRLLPLSDVPLVSALGLLGMFGTQFLYILGLTFISADVATILNLSQVPFTTIIALLVGQESCGLRKCAGLVFAVGGSVLLAQPWQLGNSLQNGSIWGYLCIPGACLCYAGYYVLQKPALRRYPPLTVTAWSYGFGALLMGIVCFARYGVSEHWRLAQSAWVAVGFAVVFNSVTKYALGSFANAHAEATSVMSASCAIPVVTAICAYVDPNQREFPFQWRYLAFLPILAGVFLLMPPRKNVNQK